MPTQTKKENVLLIAKEEANRKNKARKISEHNLDDMEFSNEALERSKNRRARPKKPIKEDGSHVDMNHLMHLVSAGTENLSVEEISKLEEQKKKLHYLLGKGKEKGYVTNSEINDNLPDHITDPEIIDQIIMMIETLGIKVFEYEPSREHKT